MADVLSQKDVVAYIMAFSKVILDFNEWIKHATKLDVWYMKLRQQVIAEETIKYWLEGELFVIREGWSIS